MYGFILKDKNDYGLIMGEAVYYLRDGIETIDEDVEIGFDKSKVLNGYSFGINKAKKIWRIRDTGQNCCKEIIASGKYGKGFEESLEPIMKVFSN